MSAAREAVTDRMAREIATYLAEEVFPQVHFCDEVEARMTEPDQRMNEAVQGYERGEITYVDLEAAGTEFVEAWAKTADAYPLP